LLEGLPHDNIAPVRDLISASLFLMTSFSLKRTSTTFWISTALILLLAFALRLWAINSLPLTWDEGLHIGRAYSAQQGQMFYWNIRKWLYPVFLAAFQPGGTESLWLARTLSALLGTLTAGFCITLGRMLRSSNTGLLAGLIYALLPLALFHEIQALSDALLAMLLTFSLILSLCIARHTRWWHVPLLGCVFAAAYLTKISALPFVIMPFLAVMLFALFPRGWLPGLAVSWAAIVLAVGIVSYTYTYVIQHGGIAGDAAAMAAGKISELAFGEGSSAESLTEQIIHGASFIGTSLVAYFGIGLLVLIIIGLGWVVRGIERRVLLFLAVPGIAFLAATIIANRPVDASRYLMPNAAPLVVLAAITWSITSNRLTTMPQTALRLIPAAMALLVFAPMLWFDAMLLLSPERTPLTPIDYSGYFRNTPASGPYLPLGQMLGQEWLESDGRSVDVLLNAPANFLQAYLGPRVGDVVEYRPDDTEVHEQAAGWFAQGDRVFYVEETISRASRFSVPFGASESPIATYSDGFRTVRVFEITQVNGAFADQIYAERVPTPRDLTTDIEALIGSLSDSTSVLVFPSNYATPLIEAGVDAQPLEIGVWPATADAFDHALSSIDPSRPLIDVVLVDEANADPERYLLLNLQQRWYRAREEWYGPLHRITYVIGPTDAEMIQIGATYEGGIELAAYSTLPEAHPGDTVPILLEWQTPVAIQDSFKVFVHVIEAQGSIVAQADSIPGGGLLPMTGWQPGEVIADRFAIVLPPDLASGEYEIRVGIYNPATKLRLPVLNAPEHGGDYVIMGQLRIP
jgi:hypothetical protein